MFSWPFSKTYRIRCPDGSIKTVYRKVDDAFPLFIPGWKGDVSAELKAFEQLPANIKANYETKIQGLLYTLDDRNQSLMMEFRGIYIAYHSDPCGLGDFFRRELEKLIQEQRHVSLLRLQIQGLIEVIRAKPNIDDQVLSMFGDIVQGLGGKSIPQAAALEVENSRALILKWIRGARDDR